MMAKIQLIALCAVASLMVQGAIAEYPPCKSSSPGGNHLVSLQKFVFSTHGESFFHDCTGSIISEKWVLTAAHCFNGYGNDRPDKWRVIANEVDLREVSGKEQRHKVKRVVRFPGFRGPASPKDVALVELASPIDFSSGEVASVCLPENADEELKLISEGEDCAIAGWGLDMPKLYEPKVQTMPVTIYNEASCRRHYGDLATAGFCYADDQTKFCRDDINVFVAPWGSPMACTMKKGGPVVQVSMLNWAGTADPCEDATVPLLFTKASFVREWIFKTAHV